MTKLPLLGLRTIGCVILWLGVVLWALPAGAAERPANETQAATGRFLVISDVHFDPFLGLSRSQFDALAAAPLTEWPARLAGQPVPKYGADSPFALVQSCLDDAKARLPDPDFILLPGDFLAHNWPAKYDQLAAQTHVQNPAAYRAFTGQVMRLLAARLRQAFPTTPILPVLGNDDSECGDYKIAPASPFLEMLAEVWAPLVFNSSEAAAPGTNTASRREFKTTVERGGGYSIRLPRLTNHRLIALNTIFWTPQYRNDCGNAAATPADDQLRWLETTLEAAEGAGERVWLLTHVPPGIDAFETYQAGGVAQPLWQPELTARFLDLVQRHQRTLQLVIAGHTHRDDFRVFRLKGRPVLLTKIVPSISPLYGNNPGYQIFEYDRRSGMVENYITCGLALNGSVPAPTWTVEYDFVRAYGPLRFDAPSIAQLGAGILTDRATRTLFRQFYAVGGQPTPVPDTILSCAILNLTVSDFTECFVRAAGAK